MLPRIALAALLVWPISSTITPDEGYSCLRVITKNNKGVLIAQKVEKYYLTDRLDVYLYLGEHRRIELRGYDAIASTFKCSCGYDEICTNK